MKGVTQTNQKIFQSLGTALALSSALLVLPCTTQVLADGCGSGCAGAPAGADAGGVPPQTLIGIQEGAFYITGVATATSEVYNMVNAGCAPPQCPPVCPPPQPQCPPQTQPPPQNQCVPQCPPPNQCQGGTGGKLGLLVPSFVSAAPNIGDLLNQAQAGADALKHKVNEAVRDKIKDVATDKVLSFVPDSPTDNSPDKVMERERSKLKQAINALVYRLQKMPPTPERQKMIDQLADPDNVYWLATRLTTGQ